MPTAQDLVGLPLYAKSTVLVRRRGEDSAPVLRTVPPGGLIGTIRSWVSQKPGSKTWYFEFDDFRQGFGATAYVAYTPDLFDMARLKKDMDKRIEEARRRNLGPNGRALEDAGGVARDVVESASATGNKILIGALILGGIAVYRITK